MTYNDIVLKQRASGKWVPVSDENQNLNQPPTQVIQYPSNIAGVDTNIIIVLVLGLIAGLVLANTIYNSKCKC